MPISKTIKHGSVVGLLALGLAGCTVAAVPPSGAPFPAPGPAPAPAPAPEPEPPRASDIALSPGIFYGANGIRARVGRSGRGYTVQNLVGKNGPKDFYADQGGNRYEGPNGYFIQVNSPTQFNWRGVHGFKLMHDRRKDAR